ncbi:MAG: ABC transporter permease [Oscillospiraceae bacterium]|nr:ABC transporter permease [Oscillospiraceae bacterium]
MKNNTFRGALTVAKYTLTQHYKSLSVKIILLVLAIFGFASVPLLRVVFETGEDKFSLPEIRQVYLRNDTDMEIEPTVFQEAFGDGKAEVTVSESSDEAFGAVLASEPTSIAYVISEEDDDLCVRLLYAKDGEVSGQSADVLSSMGVDAMYQVLLNTAGVNEIQKQTMLASVYGDVKEIADLHTESQGADMEAHSSLNLLYCYLVIFVSMLSMSYIISLTLEEKTSKLVDTLLVSVSPTALLAGKILSVIIFVTVGILVLAGSFGVSLLMAKSQGSIDFLTTALESVGAMEIIRSIGLKEILLLITAVLLAYGMIAFIASIFGSCCSKTEDVQYASMGVLIVVMIGYFAGLIIPMVENKAATIVASLFPPTAMFMTPVNYICGKISLPVLLASYAIQAVCVVVLAILAGKVYHMMILYRGDFPKMKQLFKMLRENQSVKKEGGADET